MECQDFKPNGAGQATMLFGATVRAETLRLAGKCYDVLIDAGGRYLLLDLRKRRKAVRQPESGSGERTPL